MDNLPSSNDLMQERLHIVTPPRAGDAIGRAFEYVFPVVELSDDLAGLLARLDEVLH